MAPADYISVRDQCIARKKKKNGGKISHKAIQECKKIAAIVYFKKHGKPVQHADAKELPDSMDLSIWEEQLDIFGSMKEYEDFQVKDEKESQKDEKLKKG